jgi:branched-chain amino acid transport system permease protein
MKGIAHFLSSMYSRRRLAIFFLTGLVIFPAIVQDPYVLHLIILSLMFAVLSLSWNFICGYTGIFTFGHQAFFGIGAYVSALLATKAGVSPWFGLLIGGIVPTILGFFIGLPCLRLRSAPYIALTTLGFAEIARIICMNLVDLTRGEMGLWGIPPLADLHIASLTINFSGASRVPYYYLILIVFVITLLILYEQVNSPTGLALKAIRDSQDAAESLGVAITRYKLLAFLISSFFAGVIGAFYAHYINILTPTSIFGVGVMVEIIAITLIGGLGTLVGPIVGAFILTIGLEYLRAFGEYRLMIYGILLVIIILFMPDGLAHKIVPDRKKVLN